MAAQETNFYDRLKNRLNPLMPGIGKGEKYSRILILVYLFFAILNVYDFFWYITEVIDYSGVPHWVYFVNALTYLMLPVILYIFALRKNIGWVLFGGFICYMLFSVSYNFFYTIVMGPSELPDAMQVDTLSLVNFRLLLYTLVDLGALYLMFRPEVRALYLVKKSQAFGVFLFGALLFALFTFTLFA